MGLIREKIQSKHRYVSNSSFNFEFDREKTGLCLMVSVDEKDNPKFVSRSTQISESLRTSFDDEDKSDLSHEETLVKCNFKYEHPLNIK